MFRFRVDNLLASCFIALFNLPDAVYLLNSPYFLI